jgi:hypothetical protein
MFLHWMVVLTDYNLEIAFRSATDDDIVHKYSSPNIVALSFSEVVTVILEK